MEQLSLLLLLCFSMLVGSFLSGLIPMAFRLSDSKSRLLALMGSGILVGTALAIIIPEGIDSLYSPYNSNVLTHSKPAAELKQASSQAPIDPLSSQILISGSSAKTQALIIGLSLVAGFILMLFIDQFSIYQGMSRSHVSDSTNGDYIGHHNNDYSLTGQHDDGDYLDNDDDEEDEIEQYNRKTLIENSAPDRSEIHIKQDDPSNSKEASLRVSMRGNGDYRESIRAYSPTESTRKLRLGVHKDDLAGTKVTPTLGLVIHASADGIALGAAATTSHREVEMIIFLAIMLHKAPAAFSLVVFLLHKGLKHSTIRRHLMAFSLSAPLAALVTYFGLGQSGKEALRQNNATGIAMLFSAGTFLYVATVHILPELVHNKLLSLREMLFLVGGAFLPILLAQSV